MYIHTLTIFITVIVDLDECTIDSGRSDKLFCDYNAYCIEYAGVGSYACVCKDGYSGDGKVGNCKKDKNRGMSSYFKKEIFFRLH